MTLEEKREAIKNYCDKCVGCKTPYHIECPLFNTEEECYEDNSVIDRNYDVLVEEGYITDTPKETDTKNEAVNHPSHYNQGGIECIDAMEAAFGKEAVKSFCLCNALKYLWRQGLKNGLQDCDKAIWYISKFKELSDGKTTDI